MDITERKITKIAREAEKLVLLTICLLYTSDAADE